MQLKSFRVFSQNSKNFIVLFYQRSQYGYFYRRQLSPLPIANLCRSGSKGWRSGESARLPPMWPGFESRRRRHMWVEFVVGSLLFSERFFSGYSGFPLSSKTKNSMNCKFQFDQESGQTKNHFVDVLPPNYQLFIHLFIISKFDRRPSKLVKINRQSSKLPPH